MTQANLTLRTLTPIEGTTKGSALTFEELDQNLKNLANVEVLSDTTPQLGGPLDVNGQSIVSASAGDITITPDTTGSIVLDGLNWPQADGTANQVIITNGLGQLSFAAQSGGISNVVEDTTPQLGGSLDVNGQIITSVANGNVTITPNGTGYVNLDGLAWPQADGTNGQVLTTDGAGVLTFSTASGGLNNIVEDLTPQLGGNLDTNGKYINNVTNAYGPVKFELVDIKKGSGTLLAGFDGGSLGMASGWTIFDAPNLIWQGYADQNAVYGAEYTHFSTGTGASNEVKLTNNGAGSTAMFRTGTGWDQTGSAFLDQLYAEDSGMYFTTGNLVFSTLGLSSGDFVFNDGLVNRSTGDLFLIKNAGNVEVKKGDVVMSSGKGVDFNTGTPFTGTFATLSNKDVTDYTETVYTSLGTTGTISPDPNNGSVQAITLTGSITLSSMTNVVAGQTVTVIITQPASGGPYTLTSTMKFAGGEKTLSTAANAIDIMTIFYDGTNYFASLAKGFA